jgi:hypothetical protein
VDWEPVVLAYHRELVVPSKPVDEGDLQYVAFKVVRLHLAKTKWLEVQVGRLKSQRQPK